MFERCRVATKAITCTLQSRVPDAAEGPSRNKLNGMNFNVISLRVLVIVKLHLTIMNNTKRLFQ